MATAFITILMVKGWTLAVYSFTSGEHSTTAWREPLGYIKIWVPIGYAVLLLTILSRLVKGIHALCRWRPPDESVPSRFDRRRDRRRGRRGGEIVDFNTAAIVCLSGMIVLLLLGVPIAYAIGFVSVVVGWAAFGDAGFEKMGRTTFLMLYKMSWTPLPLFTLLACIISQTRMGEDIFAAAKKWLSRVPGGLVVSTVFGEAVMAAALGSSTPTIIAMGKVAEPEFERYHYDKPFAVGATVAGGVLGPLIPPSTTMIIFAVMSSCSLGTLMIAGVLPGIVLALMLAATAYFFAPGIQLWALGPDRYGGGSALSLKNVWPIVVVMVAILGSIYAGIATPTEAGGIGCFAVLVIAVLFYGLRWKGLFAQ